MTEKKHAISLLLHGEEDRRLMARCLRQCGFQVYAPHPSRARPWLWENSDLVILDEAFAAGLQGRSLLDAKVREDSRFLPVLVARRGTGSARWLRMGYDDVLDLPPRRSRVNAQVRMFLRLRDRYDVLASESRMPSEGRRQGDLSSRLLSALEDEKKRLAQELHDSVGQTLAAIKFGLEKKLTRMERGAAPPGFSLEDVVSIVQNSIEEVRRIMAGLRPLTLDHAGMSASIDRLCREFQKVYSGIRIESRIAVREGNVPGPLKLAVYRILQEALNNVARHSGASTVRLSLESARDFLKLSIVDDGVGFDPGRIPRGGKGGRGLGLESMRHRAELSGGSLSIEAGPGRGTVIRASWPCRADTAVPPGATRPSNLHPKLRKGERTMKKQGILFTAIFGIILLLAAGAFAAGDRYGTPGSGSSMERSGDRPYQSGYDRMSSARETTSKDLIGKKVENQNGDNLGDVADLVIDRSSGRVSYAVLDVGGVLGVGEKRIAVPFAALQPKSGGDRLVLNANVDKDRLKQAPEFRNDSLSNPNWHSDVDRFFGSSGRTR
jgi:signal transduction histidine kinase/sporulation protein YlmC with PRC-barrel domain